MMQDEACGLLGSMLYLFSLQIKCDNADKNLSLNGGVFYGGGE